MPEYMQFDTEAEARQHIADSEQLVLLLAADSPVWPQRLHEGYDFWVVVGEAGVLGREGDWR